MAEVMQILGTPTELYTGPPRFLMSYNVDAYGGSGRIEMTRDLNEAMVFEDGGALRAWNTQSTVRPTRLDGRPNKPVSYYTIAARQIVVAEEPGLV